MGSHHASGPSSPFSSPLKQAAALIPLRGAHGAGKTGPPGQPVIALALILALWIAIRMTFIGIAGEPAATQLSQAALQAKAARAAPAAAPAPARAAAPGLGAEGLAAAAAAAAATADPAPGWLDIAPYTPFPDSPIAAPAMQAGPALPRQGAPGLPRRWWTARKAQALAIFAARSKSGAVTGDSGGNGAALQWWLPPGGGARFTGPVLSYRPDFEQTREALRRPSGGPAGATAPLGAAAPGARAGRWSADGWMLLRGGDSAPALAAGAASYGGSQAGAVLRYRLAPASPLAPQAYLRTSGALGGTSGQAEAALGLMLRPVRRLPLVLLGEVRVQNQGGLSAVRPVIMGVTQLPPQRLPLGFEGEAYAQGGWAGGRDATAFYDLAATVQHPLVRPLQGIDLSAGGGLWSGGQRGAARLDLGPRIELRTMIGPEARRIGVRVGVDWRFRIAGKAEPGSGPALTVAAGF